MHTYSFNYSLKRWGIGYGTARRQLKWRGRWITLAGECARNGSECNPNISLHSVVLSLVQNVIIFSTYREYLSFCSPTPSYRHPHISYPTISSSSFSHQQQSTSASSHHPRFDCTHVILRVLHLICVLSLRLDNKRQWIEFEFMQMPG